MESLKSELQSEKQLSISARNAAKSASKECEAIKRAIQSLGCKVQVSSNGYCTVDIEGDLMKNPTRKVILLQEGLHIVRCHALVKRMTSRFLSQLQQMMCQVTPSVTSVKLFAHYALGMEGADGLMLVVLIWVANLLD